MAQGFMVRIAAILLVIGGTLMAGPATAQFGNIFGNPSAPRPPADVPNGFPSQPPPVGNYPDQRYPNQGYPNQGYPSQSAAPPPAAAPPPSGIQAQPLPPPPGGAAAPPPGQRAKVTPPGQPATNPPPAQPANAPPGAQPANPPPPQPADTTVQPDDTVVTETPTQKIVNDRAVFSGLDKITGRIISFDAAINETVQFGALQVTARACYTRPPTEATNTDAFVEVDEVTLKGEIKRIFTGWMFASSPGLHAVEHPIYDVWLTDCGQPEVAQAPAPPAPPAAGQPPPPKQPRQPATAAQAPRRPAVPAIAPSAPAPVTND
jgi:hypothetical protein